MTSASGELRRELGLFDATTVNAGTMIASGIFIVPGTIVALLMSSGPSLLVWVLGGLVSLCGALCLGELGAAMPEAGGMFVYLRRTYGPLTGFLYGWGAAVLINPASMAAVAVGFATYLGVFFPMTPWAIKIIAGLSIIALTLLNCRGLRVGAVTQNVLTVIKVAALLAIPVVAFTMGGASSENVAPLWPEDLSGMWAGFGPAMIAVLWTYDGWIEATYVGSEIRNPGRNLPLSLVLSTLLIIALYVLVNAAYLLVLSPARVAGAELVASDSMRVVLGAGGAAFIAAAIVVSTLGANNGMIFTSARIPYAMAKDGLFFGWSARTHQEYRTPIPALLAQMVVTLLLTLTGSYIQLATYVVFVSFVFYALSAAAVITLRRREPELERPYRAWGYPLTPLVFIAFAVYLVADTVVHAPLESALGLAILFAGVPFYWYWSKSAPTPQGTTP